MNVPVRLPRILSLFKLRIRPKPSLRTDAMTDSNPSAAGWLTSLPRHFTLKLVGFEGQHLMQVARPRPHPVASRMYVIGLALSRVP